jgi:Tol biopolymer transport system component
MTPDSLPGQERDPSFSPDGNQIVFVWDGENGDNEDIYIKVIGAGVPLRLTTSPAADRNPWALVDTGIYFLNTEAKPHPALQFLNFAGHRVVNVAAVVRKPVQFEPGIAVSPDGRWILYTQEDHSSSDIMLVENFR